jgi:hypothetical protein
MHCLLEKTGLFVIHYQWMAAGSAFAKAVIQDSESEESMLRNRQDLKALPEFIRGDPVIVWVCDKNTERIRIVHSLAEDGIRCFWDGLLNSWMPPILHQHYKPLPNYDYGGRNVWGSEDDNNS